jgi:flagellar hook-associated protein 3 FlgL
MVKGTADLSPQLAAGTRLSELNGATGDGVRPGLIQIGNGTTTAVVDLSNAGTVGDVVNAINAAGVGGITATAGPGAGLTIAGTAGDNITITDVGGGTTAADLGIRRPVGAGPGAPLNGASTGPRVTPMTRLTDLRGGAGIDLANGLAIRNGADSATVVLTSPPLRSPATVEDLLNAVNGSDTGVLARINDAGTGIDIVNPNQGAEMSIGENGGTTAAELGVRSFTAATPLSELNGGRGVHTAGGDDFSVTRTDGTSFTVDVDGAVNVQDVIDRFNAADTQSGTQPARVVASLAPVGNGIMLTDSAGGAGAVALTPLNFSDAVKDLGLSPAPTAGGTTIVGTDVNPVAPQGIFGHLAKLRDALEANDTAGITATAEGLQADHDRVVRIRGVTGARVQELESRHERLEDQNVATQALLSELADTDFTKAITRFQTLQTALQGTLQTAGRAMNLSLLDFLG